IKVEKFDENASGGPAAGTAAEKKEAPKPQPSPSAGPGGVMAETKETPKPQPSPSAGSGGAKDPAAGAVPAPSRTSNGGPAGSGDPRSPQPRVPPPIAPTVREPRNSRESRRVPR